MKLYLLFLLSVVAVATPPPDIPVFPKEMTYRVQMLLKNGSWTYFEGSLHSYSTSLNMSRDDWYYFDNVSQETKSFMVIFSNETMYTFGPSPSANSTNCTEIYYPFSLFNPQWADDAVYEGVAWFPQTSRLCHTWSNVVPYVIQEVQYNMTYYADYFTLEPVGYDGVEERLTFEEIFSFDVPDVKLFEVDCCDCDV
jgi:hypothetical protein